MINPANEDFSYPPIACSRILQILDCEKRFATAYGSKSAFHFAFRDIEFRKPGSRSYKYYLALRRCKDIKEYRQQVVELYQDVDIDIEVNGEARKFPIQMVPVPKDNHQALYKIAKRNGYPALPPPDVPLVLLSTLPAPRLLGSPPTGRYRSEYLTETLTNKIVDFAILVAETEAERGMKHMGFEISKYLAPIESTLAYAGEMGKRFKAIILKPVAILLRGTIADNCAVDEDAFRVPAYCENFWEVPDANRWPILDIDMNLFCGEQDFDEIYAALQEPAVFADINAELRGLCMSGEAPSREFLKADYQKHVDLYVMTDEWVLKSIQRHLHLGLEQPWAYYYASSYPLLFDNWQEFLDSLYQHMHS